MRGWWLCLLFPGLAHAQKQPVVAVFDLEAPPGVVTAQEQATLGKIIANELAVSRRFKLVPSQEVRRVLLEKKRESYKDCYNESCQIEIGKELAASHSLGCSLQRLGSECRISLTLYDLRESVTAGAARKTGGCAPEALARLAEAAAQELGGAKASSARDEPPPLPTTDYEALAAEAETKQREADRIKEAAEAARREQEAKFRAEEADREKVRAEYLARLEQAWRAVSKIATTTAMERGRRIGILKQFLKDFATDNPREGEAKDMLVTLMAGKEPAIQMPRLGVMTVRGRGFSTARGTALPTTVVVTQKSGWVKLTAEGLTVTLIYTVQDGGIAVGVDASPWVIVKQNGLSKGKTPQRLDAAKNHTISLVQRGREELEVVLSWSPWLPPEDSRGVEAKDTLAAFKAGNERAGGASLGAELNQLYDSDIPVAGWVFDGHWVNDAELDQLYDSDILGVLRKQRNDVRGCLDKQTSADPSLEGTMTVQILVQNSGAPSQVTTEPDTFKNSVVSKCVIAAVMRWKFPPFAGRAMNIDFPVHVRRTEGARLLAPNRASEPADEPLPEGDAPEQ